jgi:hypothetical protein
MNRYLSCVMSPRKFTYARSAGQLTYNRVVVDWNARHIGQFTTPVADFSDLV